MRWWTQWYRSGGLEEVLSRRHGRSGGRVLAFPKKESRPWSRRRETENFERFGTEPRLGPKQGVEYSYREMRHVFDQLELNKKVPRPQSEKGDPEKQAAWE